MAEVLNPRSASLQDPFAAAEMTPTEVHMLVTESLAREDRAADRRRALAPVRSESEAREEDASIRALLDRIRASIWRRDYSMAEDVMRATARDLGLHPDESTQEWRCAAYETMRGLIDVTMDRLQRDRGEFAERSPFLQGRGQKSWGEQVAVTVPTSGPVANPGFQVQLASSSPDYAQIFVHPTRSTAQRGVPVDAAPPGLAGPETYRKSEIGQETAELAMPETVDAPEPKSMKVEATAVSPKCDGLPVVMLEKACADYLARYQSGQSTERIRDTVPTGEKTKKQMENPSATLTKLVAILGNVPISSITEAELTAMFALIHNKLPSTFTRSSQLRKELADGTLNLKSYIEKSLTDEKQKLSALKAKLNANGVAPREIEEAVAKARVQRYSAQTVYRMMQEAERLFRFCKTQKWISHNPMEDVLWTHNEFKTALKRDGDRSRTPWHSKLHLLLCDKAIAPHGNTKEDVLFWAIGIGVNTGMRLEEICQLNVRDFDSANGIHYMRVRTTETQNVKTENGHRYVPLNRNLINLGLLQLVELRRAQGSEALFPQLERDARGVLSSSISDAFRRLTRSLGIYEKGLDFHSLRMTVNEMMLDNGVSDRVCCHLLGHAVPGTNSKHYSKLSKLKLLHRAVETLDFDMSGMRNPFSDTPKESTVIPLNMRRTKKATVGA